MADIIRGKKHRSLQIKEKPSKAGTFTGVLLKLLNWNGWIMRKGVPKKLPSTEGIQDPKSCSKDERLHMARLFTIPDEKGVSYPAVSTTFDPHNAMQTPLAEDGISLQRPGVVARLMGLDYIPCSHAKNENTGTHQINPGAAVAEKTHQSKDINRTARKFDNSSKMVNMDKQHLQRQIASSLNINLQNISKTSFLNHAAEQNEDPRRIFASKQAWPHHSPGKFTISNSVSKLGSSPKLSESKRARLLLEAAVKTLEPKFQAGDHDRPVLVQALASRTAHHRASGRAVVEKTREGKNLRNERHRMQDKVLPIHLPASLPFHGEVFFNQEKQGLQKAHTFASHPETRELRTQHQFQRASVEGPAKKGQNAQFHSGVYQQTPPSKPKIMKAVSVTGQQPEKGICHHDFEVTSSGSSCKLNKMGRNKIAMIATEPPTSFKNSEVASIRQHQPLHEDHEQLVPLIHSNADSDWENQPKISEGHQCHKILNSSKSSRLVKDLKSRLAHKESLDEKETTTKAARQASQEKISTARRVLADFTGQRNHNDSHNKSPSIMPVEKPLPKSRNLKSSFKGAEQSGVDLLSSSVIEKNLSQKRNQSEENQQPLTHVNDSVHLTESNKSSKGSILDESKLQQITIEKQHVGHAADKSSNSFHSLESPQPITDCEENTQEWPPRNWNSAIEIYKSTKVQGTEHPDGEVPNEKAEKECALEDEDLEEILKGMLSMTISSDSSTDNGCKNEMNSLSQEFLQPCHRNLEQKCQTLLGEENQDISITLDVMETPLPPENSCDASLSAESVCRPENVEDSGQPSPVSVLEVPFEDENVCSWNREAYTEKVTSVLQSPPASVICGFSKPQDVCKRNLFPSSKGSDQETICKVVLHNLKQHFLDLHKTEAAKSNRKSCTQHEIDGLLMHQNCEGTASTKKVQYSQSVHRLASAETTCTSIQGYSFRISTASSFHDKLLSDCVIEALRPKICNSRYGDIWCRASFTELTVLGRQIVHEACKQILTWSRLKLSTINDLVDRDLSISAENWNNFQKEEEEIAARIESSILNATLHEILNDLHCRKG